MNITFEELNELLSDWNKGYLIVNNPKKNKWLVFNHSSEAKNYDVTNLVSLLARFSIKEGESFEVFINRINKSKITQNWIEKDFYKGAKYPGDVLYPIWKLREGR